MADLDFASRGGACTAQADLTNYFDRPAISPELSEYFELPKLGVAMPRGACGFPSAIASLPDGSLAPPCRAAAPLGWSWASRVARRVVSPPGAP
eukprot:1300497-Pyramimonas_sp.AAC.1